MPAKPVPAGPEVPDVAEPDPVATQPLPSGAWRYTGPPMRRYLNIPVTVCDGDVVTWPEPPANDGLWSATTDAPNRLPDNYRPDMTDEQAAVLRGGEPKE
jgi:hypothetical protein